MKMVVDAVLVKLEKESLLKTIKKKPHRHYTSSSNRKIRFKDLHMRVMWKGRRDKRSRGKTFARSRGKSLIQMAVADFFKYPKKQRGKSLYSTDLCPPFPHFHLLCPSSCCSSAHFGIQRHCPTGYPILPVLT